MPAEPALEPEPASTPGEDRLPTSTIWAYCAPMFPYMAMGMPFSIYLMKFATDVLLIAPGVMAVLLPLGRVWDAISDPLAGQLSDNTVAGRGRRRTWMLASAFPIAITIVMLWSPPGALTGVALVAWLGVALLLYETASTAFFVPYGALGLELTRDHHDRTRLFAYRHVVMAVGMVLGLGAVFLLRTATDPRQTAVALAATIGTCIALTITWMSRRVPERAEHQGRGARNIWRAIGDVFRNPHARILSLVYGVESFAGAAVGVLAPYTVEYVIGNPDMLELLIVSYAVPQFALTPLWVKLARRVGKRRLWIASQAAMAFAFSLLMFMDEGTIALLFGVILLIGAGGGCGAVLAPSIQADVLDWDELQTGERKEGAYTAVWNLVRKIAAALAFLLAGFLLQVSGYEANAQQSEDTIDAIRALNGLIPCAMYVLGTVALLRFRLDEREHRRIQAALDARSAD